MFRALEEAVEQLSIPLDGRALEAVLALRDRLEATIAEAVGAFDPASPVRRRPGHLDDGVAAPGGHVPP